MGVMGGIEDYMENPLVTNCLYKHLEMANEDNNRLEKELSVANKKIVHLEEKVELLKEYKELYKELKKNEM